MGVCDVWGLWDGWGRFCHVLLQHVTLSLLGHVAVWVQWNQS